MDNAEEQSAPPRSVWLMDSATEWCYLGNKSLTPTYLKVTTYYNYGQRDQKKDVHTFKLTLKDNWQKLLSINNPGVSKVR